MKFLLFPDPFYWPALLFSFSLVVRGVHRYNERQTSTLVSLLVSILFTIITVLLRLSVVSVIIAIYPQRSTMLLFLGIYCLLLVSNIIFHDFKNDCTHQHSQPDVLNRPDCFIHRQCSTLFTCLPRLLMKPVCDILILLGLGMAKIGVKLEIPETNLVLKTFSGMDIKVRN